MPYAMSENGIGKQKYSFSDTSFGMSVKIIDHIRMDKQITDYMKTDCVLPMLQCKK